MSIKWIWRLSVTGVISQFMLIHCIVTLTQLKSLMIFCHFVSLNFRIQLHEMQYPFFESIISISSVYPYIQNKVCKCIIFTYKCWNPHQKYYQTTKNITKATALISAVLPLWSTQKASAKERIIQIADECWPRQEREQTLHLF